MLFESMSASQQAEVVALVARAMNQAEADWAQQTFDFHFSCLQHNIDSRRYFYVARHSETITGVVGLHQYRWGPVENIWLSWFAVDPVEQGRGTGKWLLAKIEQQARELGYRKMFIETYEQPEFEHAIRFYQRQGYQLQGRIEDYLSDHSNMLVLFKSLD